MLATLAWSYVADPYLFGLAIVALGALSAAVAIAGVTAILTSRTADARAGALIGVSVAVTATALIVAFGVLTTFKWA